MTNLFSNQDYISMQHPDRGEEEGTGSRSAGGIGQVLQFIFQRRRLFAFLLAFTVVIATIVVVIELSTGGSTSSGGDEGNGTTGVYMSKGRGRLIKTLLGDYDKRDHPLRNTLNLGFTILSFDFDEETKEFGANLWLNMVWGDPRLRWNPADFDGLKSLSIPIDVLWVPDVTLYNRQRPDSFECHHSNAVISNNGSVTWIPNCYAVPLCLFNMEHTQQNCTLKFGSWTFHGEELDIQPMHEEVDKTSFFINPDWTYIGSKVQRNSAIYSCCPEPYIDITITLSFTKNTPTTPPSPAVVNQTKPEATAPPKV